MPFVRQILLILVLASAARAQLTWSLAAGSSSWPADKRTAIENAMNAAVALYNANGYFPKNLSANYNSGVPTAQANYDGWIDFGGSISTRVALHEISHTLGVGVYWNWDPKITSGKWTGTHAINRVKLFDGAAATVGCDTNHFWPYGLNYDSEDGTTNRIRHIKMVSALRRDMGIVADSDSDGIPDDWEMFHIGNLAQTAAGDYDADGSNNLFEYQADTNPAQPFTFQWTGGTGPWDTTTARWTGAATSWRNGGNDAAVFSGTAGTVTLASGITANDLTFSSSGYQISGTLLTLTGRNPSITVGSGLTATLSPVISGSAGLAKEGAGNLVLTGSNNYTGPTTISGGTFTLNPGARLYMAGGSTLLTIRTGGILSFEGNWGWDGTLRYQGVQAAENLIDGGTLRHTGPTNPASSAGAGRLFTIGEAGATLDSATAGSEFRIGYRHDYGSSLASKGGTLTLTGAGNGDLSYIIPGTGGLVKSGTGRWSLKMPNTYTGPTTVNAGTLSLMDGFSSPACAIASGAALELDTSLGSRDHATVTFTGAGTLRKSGSNIASWGTSAATFAMTSGSVIDVQSGTFIGGSGANEIWVSNKSDLQVAAAGIFAGAEANVRVDAISGAGTISSGSTDASYSGFAFGVDNGTGVFDGILSDGSAPGRFTKTGSGTQTLNGINTFTGPVTIDAGSLRISRQQGLGQGTKTITMTNGTSGLCGLVLAGVTADISLPSSVSFLTSNQNTIHPAIINESGNNSIAGNITLTSGGGATRVRVDGGTLALSGNITPNTTGRWLQLDGAGNGTFSGRLLNGAGSNTASLSKDGSGTWTITGTNHTFTGPTSVNAGVLWISGRLNTTSGITVASGASLGGIGTMAATTIQSGGSLHPGMNGPGTLATGSLALDSGSLVSFEIGSSSDLLTISGNLTLNGLLDITNTGGKVGTRTLMTYTGSLGGSGLSLRNVTPGFDYTLDTSIPGTVRVHIIPNTFTTWIDTHAGLAESDQLPSADPDKDGHNNLSEFAFGGDPSSPANHGRHQTIITDSNNDGLPDLTLSLEVRAGAGFTADGPDLVAMVDGLSYRIEGSRDLTHFDVAVIEVIPGVGTGSPKPGYEFRSFRLIGQHGQPGCGFLRAYVMLP